jgi:succinyl-CoA ligase-like protein
VAVEPADWVLHLSGEEEVGSIALYMEAEGDGERLCEALAGCIDTGVGVAVLKAGGSTAGSAAAAAHTGAVAGDQRVFRALVDEAGAAWAADPHELLELAKALAVSGARRPRGDGGLASSRAPAATPRSRPTRPRASSSRSPSSRPKPCGASGTSSRRPRRSPTRSTTRRSSGASRTRCATSSPRLATTPASPRLAWCTTSRPTSRGRPNARGRPSATGYLPAPGRPGRQSRWHRPCPSCSTTTPRRGSPRPACPRSRGFGRASPVPRPWVGPRPTPRGSARSPRPPGAPAAAPRRSASSPSTRPRTSSAGPECRWPRCRHPPHRCRHPPHPAAGPPRTAGSPRPGWICHHARPAFADRRLRRARG